jgi:hypothetical protein
VEERKHFSKMLHSQKSKNDQLMSKVKELTCRTVSAEVHLKRVNAQANRSAKRSDDAMEYSESLRRRIKDLEEEVNNQNRRHIELQMEIDEKDQLIAQLEASLESSAPIKVFGKVRPGQRGATSWPHFVWELIIKQIVNGTPPSSICANIVMFIQRFSPMTVIKETPSIWTVRRGRTVLFVLGETLAIYRLAKAKKWGQLHTDGTGRRQIAMQDLSFSIQNDKDGLFEPLLLTSSIIPKDECSETVAEAILDAINTKATHCWTDGQLFTRRCFQPPMTFRATRKFIS